MQKIRRVEVKLLTGKQLTSSERALWNKLRLTMTKQLGTKSCDEFEAMGIAAVCCVVKTNEKKFGLCTYIDLLFEKPQGRNRLHITDRAQLVYYIDLFQPYCAKSEMIGLCSAYVRFARRFGTRWAALPN